MAKRARKSTRSDAVKAQQASYELEALATGKHRQWNMKAKTEEKHKLLAALESRFPDLTLSALTWLALTELAAKKNRR